MQLSVLASISCVRKDQRLSGRQRHGRTAHLGLVYLNFQRFRGVNNFVL